MSYGDMQVRTGTIGDLIADAADDVILFRELLAAIGLVHRCQEGVLARIASDQSHIICVADLHTQKG